MTWYERIKIARKRGYFTEKDHSDAENWNRCAVGEAIGGFPSDPELAALGYDFWHAIDAANFGKAENIIGKITERVRNLAKP